MKNPITYFENLINNFDYNFYYEDFYMEFQIEWSGNIKKLDIKNDYILYKSPDSGKIEEYSCKKHFEQEIFLNKKKSLKTINEIVLNQSIQGINPDYFIKSLSAILSELFKTSIQKFCKFHYVSNSLIDILYYLKQINSEALVEIDLDKMRKLIDSSSNDESSIIDSYILFLAEEKCIDEADYIYLKESLLELIKGNLNLANLKKIKKTQNALNNVELTYCFYVLKQENIFENVKSQLMASFIKNIFAQFNNLEEKTIIRKLSKKPSKWSDFIPSKILNFEKK